MPILNLRDEEVLGKIASVDAISVIVEVENVDQLRRLQANRLAVLQSDKSGQYLIGLITQMAHKRDAEDIINDGINDYVPESNPCRIAPIDTILDCDGEKENVLRRALESVPEVDADCFSLGGRSLIGFVHMFSSVPADGNALTLGRYTLDEHIVAYPDDNKFFQHRAFIGDSAGSGKSWMAAKIIGQVLGLSITNTIIFNLHGEYTPLADSSIRHFKMADPVGVEAKRTLNGGVIYLPYWLLSYRALAPMFANCSDQNMSNQTMIMAREISHVKLKYLEGNGQHGVLEHFIANSPVSSDLDFLMSKLDEINVEMVAGACGEEQDNFFGKLAHMISRLENRTSGRRLGFMFNGGGGALSFIWLKKSAATVLGNINGNSGADIGIINFLKTLSDVLPLIVSPVVRVTFSVQRWTPSELHHPAILLCDGAHLYMSQRSIADSADDILLDILRHIAKENRRYGVSLVVISQHPSEVNKTMFSQYSNFVSIRLTSAEDQGVVRRLLPDSLGGFSNILPTPDIGETLVVDDAGLLPSRIRIEEPKNKSNSGAANFWDD